LSDKSCLEQDAPVPDSEPRPSDPVELSSAIVEALQGARARLLECMALQGLTPQSGWRIKEQLRHTVQGTEWILSPIHLREMPPPLETRVCIDADGRLVPQDSVEAIAAAGSRTPDTG